MLGGGGGGVPGGHSPLAVTKEVKMVAGKGKHLLATSQAITGSECSHAQLLGVIKAESQVWDIENKYKKTYKVVTLKKRNTNTRRHARW